MDMKFKFRTSVYIATSLIILLLITVASYVTGAAKLFENYVDINYFDLLVGQIANTLIVLSLTSVLSSNFGQAYWVDIKDTKLITPFWGCFIGITVYLLTALVFSIFAYATGYNAGVVISAVFATILLIILTFKMISIYFGKEELKKQLSVEYKHMLILNNSSYVSDYLRRLKKYLEEIEKKDFSGKSQYMRNLKKEILTIEKGLDSKDEEVVDATHKKHIDNHIKCMDKVKNIDLKIEEYTQNAIDNNETEVVRENVELLVECENYDTFFNLVEELFDWDEKYTCKILLNLSKKNMAWIIKDKMSFFKQYALQRLITQSGKLDAIQNLLLIYDTSNLGMTKLEPQIRDIKEKCLQLKKETRISNEIVESEDFGTSMRKEREAKRQLKEKDEQLRNELISILESAGTKDIRAFYIPIREACIAYEEGKYEIVNKYITVILANFNQDIKFIKSSSGLMDVDGKIQFTFSYVTDEEILLINQLIEKDKVNLVIPEKAKIALSKMDKVTIDNNPWSEINSDTMEIYRERQDQ